MSFRLNNSAKLQGISLVEMLVVLVIVSILAFLLFGSIKNSVRISDKTRCLHNLKTIGQATLVYAAEHEGTLPGPLAASLQPAYYTRHADADPRTLVAYLRPYLELAIVTGNQRQVADIMVCPAGLKTILAQGSSIEQGRYYAQMVQDIFGDGTQKQYPFGYRYSDDRGIVNPVRLSNIPQPSQIQILRDGFANSVSSKADPSIPWQHPHQHFFNALYLDGHVGSPDLP